MSILKSHEQLTKVRTTQEVLHSQILVLKDVESGVRAELHWKILNSEMSLEDKFKLWTEFKVGEPKTIDEIAGYSWLLEANDLGYCDLDSIIQYAIDTKVNRFEVDLIELNINSIVDE